MLGHNFSSVSPFNFGMTTLYMPVESFLAEITTFGPILSSPIVLFSSIAMFPHRIDSTELCPNQTTRLPLLAGIRCRIRNRKRSNGLLPPLECGCLARWRAPLISPYKMAEAHLVETPTGSWVADSVTSNSGLLGRLCDSRSDSVNQHQPRLTRCELLGKFLHTPLTRSATRSRPAVLWTR